MTDRNWEAELAKIDKQLASISDDQLVAEKRAAATAKPQGMPLAPLPAGKAAAPVSVSTPTTAGRGQWRGWLQVTIAAAAAVGLFFWPWPSNCGVPLYGFVAASGFVALLGAWSAVGSWKHRLGIAHIISLLVVATGILMGAREVLPRVGYAMPDGVRGPYWNCVIPPAPTTPPLQAVPTPPPTGGN
jgi:hypothetical protein